jgi:hypothetical protein
LGLAREYSTPLPYWLGLPLRELLDILKVHNEMYLEARQRAEAAQY